MSSRDQTNRLKSASHHGQTASTESERLTIFHGSDQSNE